MILSEKQIRFIAYPSKVDVIEGASGTGKSQILKMKFVMKANDSPRTQHFIAAQSAPVAYRNLIDDDNGILALFKNVKAGTDPRKGNHLVMIDTQGRKKYIYIFGFGDSAKWKKVLGSTTGCGLIDEANLAQWQFIVQCFRGLTRPTDDFWLGLSLNPQDPGSEVYTKLINKARPTKDYVGDIPISIIEDLRNTPAAKDYIYWHFNHKDNPSLTEEGINALKEALIPGTPEYLSLVEGLRSVASGTVYAKYMNERMYYDNEDFDYLEIGIDIGSGGDNASSILTLTGYKRKEKIHLYAEESYECEEQASDKLLNEWVEVIGRWWHTYNTKIRGVYIDGAGVSKTLILSTQDRLRNANIYIDAEAAWKFGSDGGIKARMFVMFALINQERLHIKKGNKLYEMLKRIVRGKDTPIEDNNDVWNDYYDSFCYSWTHNTEEIR